MATNSKEYMKNWVAHNKEKRHQAQKRYRDKHKKQIKEHFNLPFIKQREKERHRVYNLIRKEENYERPHIDVVKKAGLKTDECWNCGKKESECKKRLHLHHKNGDREDERIENLEMLCNSCHTKRHNEEKNKHRNQRGFMRLNKPKWKKVRKKKN